VRTRPVQKSSPPCTAQHLADDLHDAHQNDLVHNLTALEVQVKVQGRELRPVFAQPKQPARVDGREQHVVEFRLNVRVGVVDDEHASEQVVV